MARLRRDGEGNASAQGEGDPAGTGAEGTGSPQAQRIQIARSMQIEFKKELAKTLAGIAGAAREDIADDLSTFMARVFAPVQKA